jgi:signal transduction histidine kinase/CHASE3 domain sensor protein
MNFYANLKIRDKLILGFSTVVCLALALGIFGYFQIHKLGRADKLLFENGVKPLEYIGDIGASFHRLRVNVRECAITRDEKNDYYRGRIFKFRSEIDAIVTKLGARLSDAEAKKLFARVMQTRADYTPHINRIIELSKQNRNDEAVAYLRSSGVEVAEHAEIDAIENLQEYLLANAEKISEQNTETATTTGLIILCLAFGSSLLAAIMTILITRSITNPLRLILDAVRSQQTGSKDKARLVEAIAGGDLDQQVIVSEPLRLDLEMVNSDETGLVLMAINEMSDIQYILDQAFAEMTNSLRHKRNDENLRNWFKNGKNELNTIGRGDKSTAEFTEQTLAFLAGYLGAGVGVFYVFDEKEAALTIAAGYAFSGQLNGKISLGEGLAGQAALERKMICMSSAPSDYLRISSGLGESEPANIVVLPLLHNNTLVGLLELGSFAAFREDDLTLLNQIMETLAIALSINISRQLVNELLEQTQAQSEELRVQQEELQQTNEELEERAQMLEQQREQIRARNRDVEEASNELRRKAEELERVSTYKSEFLANMSHELRTPLNSLMILSSLLRDNREGNLTGKQVEFAATINGAGRDLLNLINDILDLSKIESGHMEFHYDDLMISEVCAQLEATFNPIAGDKGIAFTVAMDEAAPATITADGQRTMQVLKNLLSNACKFTSEGTVTLRAYSPDSTENPLSEPTMAFAVSDTGIGIPDDKQSLIFNAFQQADGSTSRTYGGTGLGLSISRQLARSMGGEIFLSSVAGKGSTFTLYLPLKGVCSLAATVERHALHPKTKPAKTVVTNIAAISAAPNEPATVRGKAVDPLPAPIPDDRDKLQDGEKSILVIEDDLTFAGILADMVRGRGFAALVAAEGESGIALAERHQPNAIILDVMLPHIDGWGVMRSLKDNPATRHIPVHFITCLEERQKAMSMGAIGFVTKPVSSEQLDTVFGTLERH